MKKRLLCLLLCAFLIFVSCARQTAGSSYTVYYLNSPDEGSTAEVFRPFSFTTLENDSSALAEEMIRRLHTAPTKGFAPLLTAETDIQSMRLEGSSLLLDFTEGFRDLEPIEQSVILSGLTRSLCAINGIDYIQITADGSSVPSRRGRNLTLSDVILTSSELDELRYEQVIFLPNAMRTGLNEKSVTITVPDNISVEELVVNRVLSEIARGNNADMVPADLKVISTETGNGVCYLNWSTQIMDLSRDDAPLFLQAFVNSLCMMQQVRQVQFLVDGQTVSLICGVKTDLPLSYEEW